jgi:hypothetical protein
VTRGLKEYDREYTNAVTDTVRRRIGYDRIRDEIERFVVQLEYEIELGEWVTVVRSDHDPQSEHGHDVAKEGVHLDVYRDSEKQRSEEIFPPMQPKEAFTYAEDHIATHAERYVKRFEEWHGIRSQ